MIENNDDIFEKENKKEFYYYSEDPSYLNKQLITYLGNKRKLIFFIKKGIDRIQKKVGKRKLEIFDGFSGSGVISRFLKGYSSFLLVNDLELYSEILNKCYLSNISELNLTTISNNIEKINKKKGRKDLEKGIIEELYAPEDDHNIKEKERVFYTNKNARIIDNIRRTINEEKSLNKKYLYIAPLLVEASVHVNTSGVFKGFYKNKNGIGQFGGSDKNCLDRIKKEIELPTPIFSKNECEYKVCRENTNDLIRKMGKYNIDLTYYDPPYNQHPYGSNYFMLNIISEYKKPDKISKISGIPKEWNKSDYNIKRKAIVSFEKLIKGTFSKFILISYNNEGLINIDEMDKLLNNYGKVEILHTSYNVFRASRNLSKRSKKVKEILFILEKK